MNLVLIATSLLPAADDPVPKPLKGKPAALVVKVQGEVLVEGKRGQRRVEAGDYLLPGQVVTAAANGGAVVVFVPSGERRRLKPGNRATLTRDGCTPADAVEVTAGPTLPRKNLAKVREVEVSEGGGVGVLRGNRPSSMLRVKPLYGTFLLSDRPAFTWPAVARAAGYVVELKDAGGRSLWKEETREARLDYPEKQKALAQGQKYLWSVRARVPGGEDRLIVDESNFKLLLKGEPEALVGVQKLARGEDPEGLLLAAAAYEGYGAREEALRVFEKLARLQPKVARWQQTLARYYEAAGRADEAKAASARAKEPAEPAEK
jgi:hypothetical protein